jgi:formylglycine-generating enzyme required for sulfatase activity
LGDALNKRTTFAALTVAVFGGIGMVAAILASPWPNTFDPGMVLIPGGPALLGDDELHALSGPRLYEVGTFLIDRFEVTNAQYAAFVTATGHAPAAFADDGEFNKADQPVTGVTWQDASDYCAWAGKRLPKETEWEKAARGLNVQEYPWGNNLDITLAHLSGEAPAPVTSHPRDESPFSVRGMAGNVSEWTVDRQTVQAGVCGSGRHHHHQKPPQAETGKHGEEQSEGANTQADAGPLPSSGTCAYIKGNSWSGRPHMTKLANRMWDYTDAIAEFVGFRCVKSMS